MPELVHFEPAPYPDAARAAAVSGDVVLKLSIDADGKVQNAEVMEAAGFGFDEAAQAAALRFRFKPATRDGTPIAVQILYRYSFTLQDKELPAPGSTVGELGGVVQAAGAEAPIAGARILVVRPDGRAVELSSDEAGRFSLKQAPPGRYELRVRAAGFDEFRSVEQVVAGEATDVVYRLSIEATELEVTITGDRPPREVTRRTLERREIERIPGTSGDALRSIQSMPGVARPPGLAGLLIVRGSAPQDSATFIDGSNVPLIYHFGGFTSVIPTELLERIDFYPGNFAARYGQYMGGIVDVALREPDTQCYAAYGKPSERTGCYHGLAQLDFFGGRALVQGPVGPAKDWTFAIGARRSWLDVLLTPVLEAADAGVTQAPVYQDYQLILHTRPTPRSSLRLQSYGADDRLELLIRDPVAEDPAFGGNVRFSTSFFRVQAIYEHQLTRDVELVAMLSVGRDDLEFSLGPLLFDATIYPVTMRSEYGFRLSRTAKLNTGIDFVAAPFEFIVRAPQPPRPGEPAPGPFAARPFFESRDQGTGFRPAWYSELELTPTPRWRAVPSLRVDYARDSGHVDISPRFNTRYDIVGGAGADPAKEQLRTTLKGGAGLFYQPPQFQETDPVFGTPNLGSNRAVHYSLGLEQELSDRIELSVEGFYKDFSDLVSRRPRAGAFVYANEGTGYAVGLETLLKYKPVERFFGWLSYTLSRSVRQEHPEDPEYLFQFDQTHNLIVLGSYQLGRGWEFGARFRLVSGPLHTPVLGPPSLPAIYTADAGAYTPLQGRQFSRRLPLFHQLDLRIDKHWQFEHWRFSAYLDVWNAYNHQAVEALVYNYDFSQESYLTGLPLIPSLGLRGEF